jgi:hypothetical protein
LDHVVEEIAGTGCMKVNKVLYALEKGDTPARLEAFTPEERDYIYHELKSVMDVYDGGVCSI